MRIYVFVTVGAMLVGSARGLPTTTFDGSCMIGDDDMEFYGIFTSMDPVIMYPQACLEWCEDKLETCSTSPLQAISFGYICKCYVNSSTLTAAGLAEPVSFAQTDVVAGYPTNGSGEDNNNGDIDCYSFGPPSCATRVVATLDKTYETGMTKAIDNIKSVLTAVAENTEGATIGIANLRATSVTWSVPMDNAIAADMDLFKTRVGDIDQVHNTKRTQFGTVFNTVANQVFGDGSKPSFIFLLSDFKLNNGKELDALAKDKRRMQRRLGEDAPKLVCYLSRTSLAKIGQMKMPKFFTELCDEQWWSGKDDASDEAIAESMGEILCGAD